MRNFNIQVLRAFAAYAVVFHHVVDSLRSYIAIGRFTANPIVGATGVDIFFVISGYVMVLSTSSKPVSPLAFMRHRIERIAPLYWLLTLIAAIPLLLGFKIFNSVSFDLGHLLRSLCFIPSFTDGGELRFPLLFTGWTLNYEMMFYLLFALGLFIRTESARLFFVPSAILVVWLACLMSGSPIARYLGSDLILAFAAGMLLFPLSRSRPARAAAAAAMIPLALLLLASVDSRLVASLSHGRLVVIFGATLLVYALLSLERRGYSIGKGWLSRQGDASYALYLVHPFVIQVVGKLSLKSGLNNSMLGLVVSVIAMFVLSGLAGVILHRLVENPLNRMIRGRSLEANMDQVAAKSA